MQRKIITTADGSKTIYLPEWDEHYHSKHGAIQEAYHVFIKMGLEHVFVLKNYTKQLNILEIGFGTGLNTIITLIEAEKHQLKINYHGVEAYPIKIDEVDKLDYGDALSEKKYQDVFKRLHQVSWEEEHSISAKFNFKKRKQLFSNIIDKDCFNLIYFDAFGARVQPELWTETIFKKMYDALKSRGILVTYSAKGSVRRAMQTVGFTVERLLGPPGKREMLRATKNGPQHSATQEK